MFVLLLGTLLSQVGLAVTGYAEARVQEPEELRVLALAYDEKSITLVWEKPEEYGNIVDYNVYLNGEKIGSSSNSTISPPKPYMDEFYADPANSGHVKAVMHNYTAADLEPSTTYRFTVRAVNRNGQESPGIA